MKKVISIILAAAMLLCLVTACSKDESGSDADANVDLDAFYTSLAEKYEGYDNLVAIEGDFLESSYPGLADIETAQFIAMAPMMSSVVNEIVLVECADAADAGKVEEILKTRVTTQAEGGAWYPDSMEAWGKAQVVAHGAYVMMVARSAGTDEIVADFNALFE